MRLDKYICDALGVTRKEAGQIIRSREVYVDGEMQRQPAAKVTAEQQIEWQNREINLFGPRYYMLNKPDGYVCSNEDPTNPTVFMLMDEISQEKLHIAGRLDVDTTGLVLITDDGQWSHRITSPKHKCEKTYRVWLAEPIADDYIARFAAGIQLKSEEKLTKPAQLIIIDETQCLLTIHEGKYHQVKRMFAAVGNKVEGLHRESIGSVILDDELDVGEYRELTAEEVAAF
ncbi:16S rRNA pseudouridine(516) synthase RsuA [Vibrio sp. SS-MA-C1-2]|uniref:16S rRNA pseudouridine(516) synthase RsuA n=1 Tax=Vibrio sp. SS-MA-C1-2 TaxID=2908646 RepID=UPI001F2186F7|nr:16S rRNA pseudouridine(516) synthase RsuA [Vibrio sp. SS-MA-C1-2]UJF20058.1 16S rRNA pseudouridine(516) synthase RsuA [Vibrio sp. SS-MA-C1-2]